MKFMIKTHTSFVQPVSIKAKRLASIIETAVEVYALKFLEGGLVLPYLPRISNARMLSTN